MTLAIFVEKSFQRRKCGSAATIIAPRFVHKHTVMHVKAFDMCIKLQRTCTTLGSMNHYVGSSKTVPLNAISHSIRGSLKV